MSTEAPLSYLVKVDSKFQGFTVEGRTLFCRKDGCTFLSPSITNRELNIVAVSPSKLAKTLVSLLSSTTHSNRVVKYAPRYRLAFSLLNEDAAQGQAAVGWDINQSLARMSPSTWLKSG